MKLTPKVREALEWFSRQKSPVKLFGPGEPTRQTIRRLVDMGFVSRKSPLALGRPSYAITDAGRLALQGAEHDQ